VDSSRRQRRPDIDELEHEALLERGHGTISVLAA